MLFSPPLSTSTAEDALDNINQISEGIVHETLKNFLETNLPKVKKDGELKYIC